MKKIFKYVPGICLALLIALISQLAADALPIHLIGASVIALFIGMIINAVQKPTQTFSSGIKFTSKKILKFAIILLGASLNVTTIMHVGSVSLIAMIFTLLTCFGGGYFIGKCLKLNWKLSNLISAGTGICGGSAIAAIAPVIEAEDSDIAYAMSATFLFDIVMILVFPIIGRAIGLSDAAYGLWSGTAVNDTSSVVAAGYAFSEAAGDFAVMVKLTRTLAIIPTVIMFAIINTSLKRKAITAEVDKNKDNSIKNICASVIKIIPWFILGFLLMSVIKSLGFISVEASSAMKQLSKFLMVSALAAIGLNTSFKDMKKSGIAPMVHGFIVSALVVVVALAAIMIEQSIGLL